MDLGKFDRVNVLHILHLFLLFRIKMRFHVAMVTVQNHRIEKIMTGHSNITSFSLLKILETNYFKKIHRCFSAKKNKKKTG